MDPARYLRVKEVFAEARALSGAGRDDFLSEACAGDPELRREVNELLLSESQVQDAPLGRLLSDNAPKAPEPSLPHEIAGYRILGVCGHGGMGTVFEAEQISPRRRVAIKVIQTTSDRPETRSRFRREAEILGRLQHPGIGQIFEAGEFEQDGRRRPFIALEFIEGLPLHAYADRHELGTHERIELFSRVCDAVEYAHEQGIVHRDLKPDNILIVLGSTLGGDGSSGGRPKVLDFGVARLVDDENQLTLSTSAGQLLGSVPYMSPEQADGLPDQIDRRSDVYSLGVVLFELLSGQLPHDLRERPLADALDQIRRSEPKALGEVDARHRGDLQTIVGKCLEKERRRRYETVGELARDLQRHLAHEPIRARPPSTLYQLAKLARRHRGLAAGILFALLSLSIGLAVAIGFAIESARSEEIALESLETAKREAYRANLSAASALLENDPRAARRALSEVPETQRAWEWRYLSSRLSAGLLDFGRLGTNRPSHSAAPMVLFDGNRQVATAPDHHHVEILDTRTGKHLDRIEATQPARCWAISSDGQRIAAGFDDGRVEVFERHGARAWEMWLDHDEPIGAVAFRPGGHELLATSLTKLFYGSANQWMERDLEAKPDDTPLVTFSADGSRLAVVGLRSSSRYQIWEAEKLELLHDRRRPFTAFSAAMDRTGDRLVIGESYSKVFVIDVASGEIEHTLVGHEDAVVDVKLDGSRVLSASFDDSLRLWDLDTDEQVAIFSEPDVMRVGFISDSEVISGAVDRLRLWSLEPRKARVLTGHSSYVYNVCFSPSGDLIGSYSPLGHEVAFWETATGELLLRKKAVGGGDRFGFDLDGGAVWIESTIDTWRQPWMIPARMESWEGRSSALAMCWDGRTQTFDLRTGRSAPIDPHPKLAIWQAEFARPEDGQTRSRVRGWLNGQPLELAESADTRNALDLGESPRLFLGALNEHHAFLDGRIAELALFAGTLSDADSQALTQYLAARREGAEPPLPPVSSANLIAHFQANGDTVELDPDTNHVHRWRASNDPSIVLERHGDHPELTKLIEYGGPMMVEFNYELRWMRWMETPLPQAAGLEALSAIALGTFGGPYHSAIFSIDSFESRYARQDRRGALSAGTSVSADGQILAEGDLSNGKPATVRNAMTGEVLLLMEGKYLGIALTPDGTRVIAGTDQGAVELWEIASGTRLAEVQGHAGRVFSVAMHPDGTRVATGGNDGLIVIRDANTLAPLLEFREHLMYVKDLAFSPDGRMLASASGDHTVRVWDTAPPLERYREALDTRELESALRAEVEALREEHSSVLDLLSAIRSKWPADEARQAAAHRILAKGGSD